MTDTVIPNDKNRNPFLNTIKDRPPRHNTETEIITAVNMQQVQELITILWDYVKQNQTSVDKNTEDIRKMVSRVQFSRGVEINFETKIDDIIINSKEHNRLIQERFKILDNVNNRTRDIESDHQGQIKILQKTIEGHQRSITLLLEHDHERLRREGAKQTERNARKDNSAWSKMKKLLPYKDELENKYIVD